MAYSNTAEEFYTSTETITGFGLNGSNFNGIGLVGVCADSSDVSAYRTLLYQISTYVYLGYLVALTAVLSQYQTVIVYLLRTITRVELHFGKYFNRGGKSGRYTEITRLAVPESDCGISFPMYRVGKKKFTIVMDQDEGNPEMEWYTDLLAEKQVSSKRSSPKIIQASMFLTLKGDDSSDPPRQFDITNVMQAFHGVYRDFHYTIVDLYPGFKYINASPYTVYIYLQQIEDIFDINDDYNYDNVTNMVIYYHMSDGTKFKAGGEQTFYDTDSIRSDEPVQSDDSGNSDIGCTRD